MSNSDMPAMPLTGDAYTDLNGTMAVAGRAEDGMGLTKREHFAGLAMQGLLSGHSNLGDSECATNAIDYADALLKGLEN
jgi:hypothetical protein